MRQRNLLSLKSALGPLIRSSLRHNTAYFACLAALLLGCDIEKPSDDKVASSNSPSGSPTLRPTSGATAEIATTELTAQEPSRAIPTVAGSVANVSDAGVAVPLASSPANPSASSPSTSSTLLTPSPTASIPVASASSANAGASPECAEKFLVPVTNGRSVEVATSSELAAAVSKVQAGDTILLHSGSYSELRIQDAHIADYFTIAGAAGETVEVASITLKNSDHVVLRGLSVPGTLNLVNANHIVLAQMTLDRGSSGEAALMIQGQDSGPNHTVSVVNSVLKGGGRTVFVLGKFAENSQWNHDLLFQDNDITCGKNVCFQISGGKKLTIDHNQIHSAGTSGILTAGANQIQITRNRMFGTGGSAAQIATPGAEWDNYAGIENMVSSEIGIINNAMSGWDTGVTLDAATKIDIAQNTVLGDTGIRFDHRIPKAQNGDVILTGNSEVRVWNNILPSINLASGESRPTFESNNAVKQGGEGAGLITADPLVEAAQDFTLNAGSPARDVGLRNDLTPKIDIDGALRGEKPDVGAKESNPAGTCPR